MIIRGGGGRVRVMVALPKKRRGKKSRKQYGGASGLRRSRVTGRFLKQR